MPAAASLRQGAVAVLATPAPADKIALTHALAQAWHAGALPLGDGPAPPARPARPPRPELRLPRDMPKRRSGGSPASRIALLHALAHIELNALDLAWDLIARFGRPDPPRGFYDDWLRVADEEATHHGLLADRLAQFEAGYGDLPAHDGLWQAAETTAHDLLARLAVVPLVLEARGLDVTPVMIASLDKAGDTASADVLRIIYRDEIGHVAIGRKWFDIVCTERGWRRKRPGRIWCGGISRAG
ncbi:MAG: ferritin-like domain-containing protein [Aliidongia sp.]